MYYVERPAKTWSVICVVTYLAGMAYMGVGALPDDLGVWLGLGALFLLPLGGCLAVPLSKLVHHRIDLDARTLRVGRERLPLDTLDPGSVRAALTGTAPDPGRPARLVGGAWGVPLGMDGVVLATRGGEHLTIATRDRTAFLTALSRATAAAPHHHL
ncbi:hypothetical protein AT728_09015 [Streptomyces silvensis]|uniref:Uncharacterized protein n=2 Tax=Streptomyces silvensis TaxID=1765722 RepID=A0A0W7X4D7_9ACTN|nr:hypothetical protein AT728_09015 [Streptomyces silvensis]